MQVVVVIDAWSCRRTMIPVIFMFVVIFCACATSLSSVHAPVRAHPPALGVYVHIPFCRRRCFYCDFPISVVGDSKEQHSARGEAFVTLLNKEMETFQTHILLGRKIDVDSIYFGGGTPSLLPNECLQTILSKLKTTFNVLPDSEVTLEADPGTFDVHRLRDLHGIGFTRLSVGVQSFDEQLLAGAGRAHTAEDALRAIDAVHQSPFSTFSIDLISSLPPSTMDTWESTMRTAISCAPKHISVYDLQVEDKTAFGRWFSAGRLPLPSESLSRDMFVLAAEHLTVAGFEHYEVSNYALPGHRSRHNQKYWQCIPTVAFGVGAASYLNNHRFTRPSKLPDYTTWVNNARLDPRLMVHDVLGTQDAEQVNLLRSAPDIQEFVMLSLRTKKGVSLSELGERYGNKAKSVVEAAALKHRDVVQYTADRRRLCLKDPGGLLVSNMIISDIFAALDDSEQ